ncbi:MAG: epoxyqueuosine reductase [Oscillospiraceae bacterium]|nr:epoxyqueuosine reductase [Oscillospiraceae bacterium]
MDLNSISKAAAAFLKTDASNRLGEEDALKPFYRGMRLLDEPLVRIGKADDPLFAARAGEGAEPTYWLDGAASVISLALPLTQEIKDSNTVNLTRPSNEWLHGATEGQDALRALLGSLAEALEAEGYKAVCPMTDERVADGWSEAYAAYVCGAGTFGASGALLTDKGSAVLLGSLITDCPLEATPRKYEGLYDYCDKCGKCARNCPAGAIDLARGAEEAFDAAVCAAYIEKMGRSAPKCASGRAHAGCGKCRVAVPCASRRPGK